jgi:UDP-N-acetylglucosamine--N-acetylmuramyl-(pentapeptide) pyrophosphoryl-undecaprenol N-acetylglucosamine transferase
MMPDAIFAKGGFASSLVLVIGIIFRIPIFIHESDSIPGLTNQMFSKFAKIVFISFEDSRKYIKNKNIELVGNPIDDDLLIVANKSFSEILIPPKISASVVQPFFEVSPL